MKGGRAELTVGIFAIIVLAILSFITFRVGEFTWGKKKGYRVYVIFEDTAGLYEDTDVKIAGVNSGVVEKIKLVEGKAHVTVRMNPEVKLYSDAEAFIRATGLLGDKYLEIKAGSVWQPEIKDGGTITRSHEIVDVDAMMKNISKVSTKLMEFIAELSDPEVKEALRETVINLHELTANMNTLVTDNRDKFKVIVAKLESLTTTLDEIAENNKGRINTTMANLEELTGALKEDMPVMVTNLREGAEGLKELMDKTGPDIASLTNSARATMDSINTITEKINKGEGTVGKLVTDEELYDSLTKAAKGVDKTINRIERFRTFLTFKGEYLEKLENVKGHIYLTLQPRKDKYYILGVVSDPIGRVEVTRTITDGVVRKEEEVEEDEIEFTAHFAKRYKSTALRIGITESTFGLGADQFLFNDRLQVSADIWDFGDDEADADDPHLRIGADFFLFKNIFISGGADNILNSNRIGAFVGGGLKFEDEDFKYIFGTVPSVPGQ
jgi:phospholipid/cholesterol/gamma-HCH transport system substrate-binding protein